MEAESFVKKDCVFDHDAKSAEGLFQQGCSNLSAEMSSVQGFFPPAEDTCRDKLPEAEALRQRRASEALKNANVHQVYKTGAQDYPAGPEIQENSPAGKLLIGSPTKVPNLKPAPKDWDPAGESTTLRSLQPSRNCSSQDPVGVWAEPGEADLKLESPLSDDGCLAAPSNLYGFRDGDPGRLGEKESEPDSPMDVDNSKNSCQGSEADEGTSPLLEDHGDLGGSEGPGNSTQFRRAETDPEFRKRQFAPPKSEGPRFSLNAEGVDSPWKDTETHTEVLGPSPHLASEGRSAKQAGRKDSKITTHFPRVHRGDEKRYWFPYPSLFNVGLS